MNDVKKCLKRLAVYYLLLAVNIFPCAGIIPDYFPLSNLSSVYLLILSVCLFLYYYLRIAGNRKQKKLMLIVVSMMMLLILLRCIKYSIFGSAFILGRYTWYLYYVPMLCIPTLLFYVALYVFVPNEKHLKRNLKWVAYVTVGLILLVLTNDLHQQVFQFQPQFTDWDSDYTHGWGFAVVTVWQFCLYAVAVGLLVIKSSITKIKYRTWIFMIPFAIGIAMMLLLLTGNMPKLNGYDIIAFPEALCFMVAGLLECCMQLGLVPMNAHYRGLLELTSLPVQITDDSGNIIYQSGVARNLTEEQFTVADNTRIGAHTILRKTAIPGGYGFWQNDVTELDCLNRELTETKAALAEESELIRLQNELKAKQVKIEHRTHVYNAISLHTKIQSQMISDLSEQALATSNQSEKDIYRKHIVLLAAYIKRYANLMLIASENKTVNSGELVLSVAEVLRYLNRYGIPGEIINGAEGIVSVDDVLLVFEVFDALLENNLTDLKGVYVNFSLQNGSLLFKLTLENIPESVIEPTTSRLKDGNVQYQWEYEDSICYLCFVLPAGGDTL